MKSILLLMLAFAGLSLAAAEPAPLLDPTAKLEKLWGEGEFTEGPTVAPDGSILFSDIGNRIMKFEPATSKITVFREPSGRSNGMKFDAMGRLIVCEGANTGGNRRISITAKDGKVTTVVDSWNGKKLNSPNDLAIDPTGRIWFTDPRYGGEEGLEIGRENVYRIDAGKAVLAIDDVIKPNGIVFSPDGKTLYVAETSGKPSEPRRLSMYPVNADGSVGKKALLYDFKDERGADGIAVTADGLIAATMGSKGNSGVLILTPEGKKVGFIPTPEDSSNLCFAGKDRKTLYITAGKSIYRIETRTVGASTTGAK